MTYYETLGIETGAKQGEVRAAFDEQLAARKARRGRTSDLHAAFAVLSDPTLRKAYDLARLGSAASEKLVSAKEGAVRVATHLGDSVSEIDVQEVVQDVWRTTLKAVVVTSVVTEKVGEAAAQVSRRMRAAAKKGLGS
jgi:DnaJ-class molecular chaperone